MPADDRSEVSFERRGNMIATVHANKAAAVGVEEVHLGVPASLMDPIHLEAGGAQSDDGVSQRRAH
jgi:hypothetical protein